MIACGAMGVPRADDAPRLKRRLTRVPSAIRSPPDGRRPVADVDMGIPDGTMVRILVLGELGSACVRRLLC